MKLSLQLFVGGEAPEVAACFPWVLLAPVAGAAAQDWSQQPSDYLSGECVCVAWLRGPCQPNSLALLFPVAPLLCVPPSLSVSEHAALACNPASRRAPALLPAKTFRWLLGHYGIAFYQQCRRGQVLSASCLSSSSLSREGKNNTRQIRKTTTTLLDVSAVVAVSPQPSRLRMGKQFINESLLFGIENNPKTLVESVISGLIVTIH